MNKKYTTEYSSNRITDIFILDARTNNEFKND